MIKYLIVSGIAVLLICVGLSGCEEISNEINSEEIDVSGDSVTQTVHNTDKPIILDVSGMNNEITVTKDTNLIEVIISGMNNVVRVSRSHSFTTDISGMDNEIVYYD